MTEIWALWLAWGGVMGVFGAGATIIYWCSFGEPPRLRAWRRGMSMLVRGPLLGVRGQWRQRRRREP